MTNLSIVGGSDYLQLMEVYSDQETGQNFIKTEMCLPRSDTNGFSKTTSGLWGLLGGIYRK